MTTTPTPADQLRAAVARALVRYDWNAGISGRDTPSEHHYGEADAVLAVLPAHALAVARQLIGTTEGEDTATDDTLHACPGRWAGPNCRCFDDETAAPPAPADRAAVLNEVAAQYEQMLADIGADTAQDPRYWTGVQHVTLGLRRLGGEAAAGAHRPSPRICCAHTDVLYGQCVRYLDDHDGDCQHEHQPTPATPAAPEEPR